MEIISDDIFKIKIKKRNNEDKKYLLENSPEGNIIGIIPFLWQKVNVSNPNKKLFLNKNYFLGSEKMEFINFRDKNENETEMTYKKLIKKEIITFFENKYQLEGIKFKNLVEILDINEGKIKIYSIYLNKNKKNYKKILKKIDDIKNIRYLIYYNNYELDDKELLENTYLLEDNKYILNKYFIIEKNEKTILKLPIRTLYNKIIADY
jgi:hypothetical protein|uniref:Uncharacterized protein n=1 Tax=Mimiviridae sp. ChoanoV1 TaxID=2596887 RepID=A0A5B8HWI0_9VIRU|nr:hypothetical protein 10_10 [Mimiviridae sp. ChoanoV1]